MGINMLVYSYFNFTWAIVHLSAHAQARGMSRAICYLSFSSLHTPFTEELGGFP